MSVVAANLEGSAHPFSPALEIFPAKNRQKERLSLLRLLTIIGR